MNTISGRVEEAIRNILAILPEDAGPREYSVNLKLYVAKGVVLPQSHSWSVRNMAQRGALHVALTRSEIVVQRYVLKGTPPAVRFPHSGHVEKMVEIFLRELSHAIEETKMEETK